MLKAQDNEAGDTAQEDDVTSPKDNSHGDADSEKGQDENERIKRLKEQVKGSKDEALRNKRDAELTRAYKAAKTDSKSFLKTYNDDPDMAKEVAEMFGITLDEALKQAGGTPGSDSAELAKMRKEMAELTKNFEEAKKTAIRNIAEKLMSEVPEKKRDEVQEEMDDYMDGKDQNETNLNKAFAKAKKIVMGNALTKEVFQNKGLKSDKKEKADARDLPESAKNPRYRHFFKSVPNN